MNEMARTGLAFSVIEKTQQHCLSPISDSKHAVVLKNCAPDLAYIRFIAPSFIKFLREILAICKSDDHCA